MKKKYVKVSKKGYRLISFVRPRREDAGLTQEELAKAVGVSVNTIASIENGGGCCISTAIMLSRVLDYPVDLLFDFSKVLRRKSSVKNGG